MKKLILINALIVSILATDQLYGYRNTIFEGKNINNDVGKLGGIGGRDVPRDQVCDQGFYVNKITGSWGQPFGTVTTGVVNRLGFECNNGTKFEARQTLDGQPITKGPNDINIEDSKGFIGIAAKQGIYIDAIGGIGVSSGITDPRENKDKITLYGGPGGNWDMSLCQSGRLVGMRITTGQVVDSVTALCEDISSAPALSAPAGSNVPKS